MRDLTLAMALWLCLVAAPAAAAQSDPMLPHLFERLRAAGDVAEARTIEQQIWRLWADVSDPEAAALLAAGTAAITARSWPRALEQLDRLVERHPDIAEGWNQRATLFYLMGDFAASVADIQRTLALEPRHFGALSGLGLIYMAIERPEAAIRAFEAALAIHPYLPGARQNLVALRQQIESDL